jgi:hypothetical protein
MGLERLSIDRRWGISPALHLTSLAWAPHPTHPMENRISVPQLRHGHPKDNSPFEFRSPMPSSDGQCRVIEWLVGHPCFPPPARTLVF